MEQCPTIHNHITLHAIERYRERVEAVSPSVVRERLSSRIITFAIKAGVKNIKLSTGHRAIIMNGKIVTVLEKERKFKSYKGKQYG